MSHFIPHIYPKHTMSQSNQSPNPKWVDFNHVKASVTMEQILVHYGIRDTFATKQGGKSLRGPCPIHRGENPEQFSIDLTKNIWKCHSGNACSNGGNLLDFVCKMEDCTLRQAALKLCDWFDLQTPPKPSTEQKQTAKSPEVKPTTPAAKATSPTSAPTIIQTENKPLKFTLSNLDQKHPYLYERGLTDEMIQEFGLGYCSKGMMAGRIVVPIYNATGDLVAYAGRIVESSPDEPKWKMPPGYVKTLDLYNLQRAFFQSDDSPLIIVEGFFDAIRIHQLGHRKVVALMGWHMSEEQERLIANRVKATDRIIIMLDEDEAGRESRPKIAGRLAGYASVHIHAFLEEGMQPDKILNI